MIPLQEIQELSNADTSSVLASVVKLQEEVGELSASVLNALDERNQSASSDNNVDEEVIDTLMCALDVYFKCGYSIEDLEPMFRKKLQKWRSKQA
jgi:hypothetical protein